MTCNDSGTVSGELYIGFHVKWFKSARNLAFGLIILYVLTCYLLHKFNCLIHNVPPCVKLAQYEPSCDYPL